MDRALPPEDFVNAAFDAAADTPPSDLLVILSTPRSGSTLLCDLLYRAGVCVAHEYFQPFQYLPALAARWGAHRDGRVDLPAYAAALRRHRTGPGGWLGVNLHGHHLPVFLRIEEAFADLRPHYVLLRRRDTVAQAVSYHIARTTGAWSAHFEATAPASYSFEGIDTALRNIVQWTTWAEAFLKARTADARTVWYEDLVADPAAVLRSLPGVPADAPVATDLRAQAPDGPNTAFAARYGADKMRALCADR
ncbi:Stf0 family sulfotransferase [Roseospira goensis]|uniref:LPS sulfotransferase NodH n=1 Tax=Roseospira goensis TaxID=391922 RepID=A0A7W6RWZ4_9PROT|nr:Stf0 family sulfotransferase [Roseospira goensis]MBB4284621.1 LPS sulfotransferase NodH [Roseospira goensis]